MQTNDTRARGGVGNGRSALLRRARQHYDEHGRREFRYHRKQSGRARDDARRGEEADHAPARPS